MSEPYAVMLRAQLGREQVSAYLQAERKRAAAHEDWHLCTGFIAVSDFRDDPEAWRRWIDTTDVHTGKTYGEAYQRLRKNALTPPFFRFHYDDESFTLTQVSVWFSQGASELVEHLTVTRGLGDFLSGTQRGFTAVHDPFLGNGTAGVIELEPGQSRVVETTWQHEEAIAAIVREFSGPDLDLVDLLGGSPTQEAIRRAGRDELDSFLVGEAPEAAGVEAAVKPRRASRPKKAREPKKTAKTRKAGKPRKTGKDKKAGKDKNPGKARKSARRLLRVKPT